MKPRNGLVLIGYGLFLVATGLIGFALTGETSTSALINGVVFGGLMVVLGVLLQHGRPWTKPAALSATAIFALTFVWRGGLQLWEYLQGDPERLPVVVLFAVMFVVSLSVLIFLGKRLRN